MTSDLKIALFAAVALVAISPLGAFDLGVAQSAPQAVEGPSYNATAIRQMEIEGVRLGMTRKAVASAMKAHGFVRRNPSGRKDAGYYESQDRRVWMSTTYSASGAGLDSFTYYIRNYSAEDASDVAMRREELLALLGRPTQWTKWVREHGEIGDRFFYAPNPELIDSLPDAGSCYVSWECASLVRGIDCRPLVRQVSAPVIEGSFGGRSLTITVTDYTQRSRTLLAEDRFRRRDFSRAVCPYPTVH